MDKTNLIQSLLGKTGAFTFKLNEYSYDARLAYISIIVSLAWADGSIDDRERKIINSVVQYAGDDVSSQLETIINENSKFDIVKYDYWVSCIDDMSLKIALMVDMFLTAFADTICMQSETIYMKYIAGKLGINDELYTLIRKNVEDYLNSVNEENSIIYEQGIANQRENTKETEGELSFRKILNSLVKSLIVGV